MEIKGKVVKVMDVLSGTGKGGKEWMKQEFIVETPGQYPKKIAMSLWGREKIDKYDLVEGLEVTASIEVESREYQGRWFTEVRAWKLSWDEKSGRRWKPNGENGAAASEDDKEENLVVGASVDDLPF